MPEPLSAAIEQETFSKQSGTIRWPILTILFLGGIGAWVYFFDNRSFLILGPWPPAYLGIFTLIVAGAAWARPIRKLLVRAFNAPRVPYAVAAGALSVLYLLVTAHQQQRLLVPYVHDEFSYLIQAQQMARGRLWMGAHPLAEFFDSFQLIVHPVYASMYFPGTAVLYVPGVWLHVPPWVTSLAIAGGVIALLHRIAAELIDPLAAWIAVLLVLACPMFRTLSMMTMAQLPLLLYGLTATFAWLRWRRDGRFYWAMLLGASLGCAAITRPIDAVCFAVPIGIAVLMQHPGNRRKVSTIAVILVAAAPFLAMQLIADRGITGNWFKTPFRLYADTDYPGTNFGFHPFDAAARPVSPLPQKQRVYLEEARPLIQGHQPQYIGDMLYHRARLTLSLASAAPFPLLMVLIPAALAGLNRGKWVVLATLPLFLCLYVFYVFFYPHYVIVVAPAIIAGILIGAKQLGELHPGVRVGLMLFIIGTAAAALPQLDESAEDQMFDAPLIAAVDAKLATIVKPAVVLFRYDPARNVDEEPVYNSDVAWPDDARIIRAHDLGPLNSRIFTYYARHQPERVFYSFDEARNALTLLGSSGELSAMSR